jgi:predicted MPP superfamily phosphohydrolase
LWLQLARPSGLEWTRVELPVPKLPPALDGLRILHLTDFHLRKRWYKAFDVLLARIADDPPDLLLSTGDYVDDKKNFRPALPLVLRLVAGFRARLGCFGIIGNHDGPRLAPELNGTNLAMIVGERRAIEIGDGGAGIELIGIPGVKRKDLDPNFIPAQPPRKPGLLRVVLSHFPDHLKRARSLDTDLFLAGHTHGGQVCLPGGVPIIKHDSLPRRLCRGIHRVGPTWLIVGRGLGFSGLPIRAFCPPEAIEIVLRPAVTPV